MALIGLGFAGLLVGIGCKKEADAPPPPLEVAPTQAPSAPPPAESFEVPSVVQPTALTASKPRPAVAPTGSATTAPAASASAKPAANYAADATAVRECCTALRKEATGANQSSYESAAKICDGIAGLVAKGTTRREAALTSIRAAVRGGSLPAGCH